MQDVQSKTDTRNLNIERVGIKGLKTPLKILLRNGESQDVVGTINMFVNLHKSQKGTHMSRFVEIINSNLNEPLEIFKLPKVLETVKEKLHADTAFVEIAFDFFMEKRAPISNKTSLMNYEVKFVGKKNCEQSKYSIEIKIPVSSVCPCSRDISSFGAHNQRGIVTVKLALDNEMFLEDIIEVVESSASAPVYSLLKRPDEKYITELGYKNAKFVEDIVRDVALMLKSDPRINSFVVECENFESIHNHSAFATIKSDDLRGDFV